MIFLCFFGSRLQKCTKKGFQCHSLVPGTGSSWVFEAVDGALGKVCRGSGPGDNSVSYFTLSSASNVTECLKECWETPLCTLVDHGVLREESWWVISGMNETDSLLDSLTIWMILAELAEHAKMHE